MNTQMPVVIINKPLVLTSRLSKNKETHQIRTTLASSGERNKGKVLSIQIILRVINSWGVSLIKYDHSIGRHVFRTRIYLCFNISITQQQLISPSSKESSLPISAVWVQFQQVLWILRFNKRQLSNMNNLSNTSKQIKNTVKCKILIWLRQIKRLIRI
jgi:hypothetical protein